MFVRVDYLLQLSKTDRPTLTPTSHCGRSAERAARRCASLFSTHCTTMCDSLTTLSLFLNSVVLFLLLRSLQTTLQPPTPHLICPVIPLLAKQTTADWTHSSIAVSEASGSHTLPPLSCNARFLDRPTEPAEQD